MRVRVSVDAINRTDPLIHSSGVGTVVIYNFVYNFCFTFLFLYISPLGGAVLCLFVCNLTVFFVCKDEYMFQPIKIINARAFLLGTLSLIWLLCSSFIQVLSNTVLFLLCIVTSFNGPGLDTAASYKHRERLSQFFERH